MTAPAAKKLLEVKDLVKHFPIKGGLLQRTVDQVHAVDGVSFDLAQGETGQLKTARHSSLVLTP